MSRTASVAAIRADAPRSGPVVVGVSDLGVLRGPGLLTTHALGSCIAVCARDPAAEVAAMLHFMLPDSGSDPARAASKPHMYADTGIASLLDAMRRLGASPPRLRVKIAGGAAVLARESGFAIGKRNILAARKLLWKHGLRLEAEEVGGRIARTVAFDASTGRLRVRSPGRGEVLL